MPNPFSIATELAVRTSTRDPNWQQQAVVAPATQNTPPLSASYGVALDDAPATLVAMSVREEVHRRTSRLTIPTLNIGDTFTITVDSNAVNYDSTGDADLNEVLNDFAAAINADGTVGPIVTATAIDSATGLASASAADELLVVGDAAADYTVSFTRTGSSVIAIVADPQQASGTLYWLMGAAPNVTAPTQWFNREPKFVALGPLGFVDRYPTGGFLRGYVQVTEITAVPGDGSEVTYREPVVWFGPGLAESSS